jgi:hypothetical protein
VNINPPARQIGPAGGQLDAEVADRVRTQRGGGASLEPGVQQRMEGALGSNFADVRIHADGESDTLNRIVGASAFTFGSDVFLSRQAESAGRDGDALLAHELTHVVQQRGQVGNGTVNVGAANDAHEREAEGVARAVGRSGGAPVPITGVAQSPTIQRQAPTPTLDEMFDAYNKSRRPANASYPDTPILDEEYGDQTARKPADKPTVPAPSEEPARPQGGKATVPVTSKDATVDKLAKEVELLKIQQTAARNQQAALALDLRWRAKFGERMASYKQAVWRVTGGIDLAQKGFQEAQVAQAQTDQLATQLIGLGAAFLFAFGFEWIAGAALGALGKAASDAGDGVRMLDAAVAKRVGGTRDVAVQPIGIARGPGVHSKPPHDIPSKAADTVSLPNRPGKWAGAGDKLEKNAGEIVEKVENPANVVVGGTMTNVRGAQQQQDDTRRVGGAMDRAEKATEKGQGAGGAGGSAVAYLSRKSEGLEQHWQKIEQAFVERSEKLAKLTEEEWATFDVGAQDKIYQGLLDQLSASAKGVESMESLEYVANIIEKYMWADWILHSADRQSGGMLHNFGTDIDLRLIKIGVEAQVHYEAKKVGGEFGLSEHWWQSSTDDWRGYIQNWARNYKGSILK